jgi:hypothetical protein
MEPIDTTGFYHKYNFLKFRILEALAWSPKPMTTKEISDKIGVPFVRISVAIKTYLDKGIPYIQRLKKKRCRAFRYKITKSGMKAYVEYLIRIERGLGLNRLRPWQIERMETYGQFKVRKQRKSPEDFKLKKEQLLPYFGVTYFGRMKFGYTWEDYKNVISEKILSD